MMPSRIRTPTSCHRHQARHRQYCITAPGAQEGVVGSLQNQGGGQLGTIRVTMGIATICDVEAGSNITVETFRID